MPEVPDTVDDALDALSSPSTDDVEDATRGFSSREIGSSAASRAIGGNGGSPPYLKNAAYDGYGAATTAPNGDEPGLPWIIAPSARYPNYLPSDDPTLLDLTDPTIPVFTEAGVYAITVTIYCTTKVAGKLVRATLQADSADYNTTYGWTVSYFDLTDYGGPAQDLPAVTFHLTPRYLPSGSIVYAGVSNFTGGTLDFFMTNFVQKVA